ncbi:MAG: hypothetical protein ACLFQK_08370, partial [Fibrobacterota bacterium]
KGSGEDSTAVIKILTGIGGFTIEKCRVKNKFNFVSGLMLGGGVINVQKYHDAGASASVFTKETATGDKYGDDIEDKDRFSQSTALLIAGDIHGIVSYSPLPYLHIGLELSYTGTYSPSGFGQFGNPFKLIFPGIGMRIIFGNLG